MRIFDYAIAAFRVWKREQFARRHTVPNPREPKVKLLWADMIGAKWHRMWKNRLSIGLSMSPEWMENNTRVDREG